MNEDIKLLNQRIKELEHENNELKNIDPHDIFSFDFLFDTVKQPAFILKAKKTDTLPIISNINKSGLDLVKYSYDECTKFSPVELGILNSEDQYKKFINSLSSNESVTYLGKIKTKDGQSISSEITLYSFSKGDTVHLLVFQRNIGNQQKVVEALRQSEYRFLQMAENIAEGIAIVEDDKIVFINSSLCHITGYKKEQLRDMDEYTLARYDEIERLKSFNQKITDTPKGTHSIDFWINTKMGQEKCIKNNYTFSLGKDGRKTTYIITSDITSRKRIEQALRKSQNDFRMLAENSPDLITRYNKDLTYTYANLTIEKITGIPISKFIGSNNLELELEANLVSFLEDMHLEVFRTGKTIKFEYRLTIKEKTNVFQAHLVPELSLKGTVESVLNVSRDITQIKSIERNLKDEKKHIVDGNLLIAQNLKKWSDKLCKNSYKISTDDTSCMKPILRIAEWTNHGYNQININSKIIKVNDLLKNFFNKNAELIEKNSLESNLILPVHDISINSDENILTDTLSLLLENAIEATKSGKIEIGYDIYNEKEIVFFVKDTGNGIHPDDTERIFKPFISVNKENHAGLGLSIAEKNISALNGIIWCLSSPETGSTFCFTHPAQIEKSLLQSKTEKNEPTWKDKQVLVVEDTDSNFLLIEALLTQYGVELSRAYTGKEGIQMVKNNANYDLVLMDIQLPGMNGYDATTEIRKFNTKVPILAQTAFAMYDNVVRALDAGCNDFIAKPIKTKKLLGIIDKYLSK